MNCYFLIVSLCISFGYTVQVIECLVEKYIFSVQSKIKYGGQDDRVKNIVCTVPSSQKNVFT